MRFFFLLCVFITTGCSSINLSPESTTIVAHGISKHGNPRNHPAGYKWNERNYGGAGIVSFKNNNKNIIKSVNLQGGCYTNSLSTPITKRTSCYGLVGAEYIRKKYKRWTFGLGSAVGIVTGYKTKKYPYEISPFGGIQARADYKITNNVSTGPMLMCGVSLNGNPICLGSWRFTYHF